MQPPPSPDAGGTTTLPANETSLPALAAAAIRHWRLVVALALACAVLAGGITVARPRTYTSAASFVPQSRQGQSGLSGLAAQFGLNLAGAEGGRTPPFYVELLTARGTLVELVDHVYSYQSDTGRVRGTLVALLDAKGTTPALRREDAITKLRDGLQATASQKTDLVTVSVRTGAAPLSYLVVQRAVELVDHFNTETRQSQARAERRFAEARLAETRVALARPRSGCGPSARRTAPFRVHRHSCSSASGSSARSTRSSGCTRRSATPTRRRGSTRSATRR
jgi:uncharacterized protein involved in exopolysaccharide biosynthesis